MAFICTEETPWEGQKGPVEHPDAQEIGPQLDDYPSGDIQKMECPNCGHRWKIELPQ